MLIFLMTEVDKWLKNGRGKTQSEKDGIIKKYFK